MNIFSKSRMVREDAALPGRDEPIQIGHPHTVLGQALAGPYPAHCQVVDLGMGCFWGAERLMWQLPGVHVTAVGYAGGFTPNPGYREVCSGSTGHTEVVRVVFDPQVLSFDAVLAQFWEAHDPTQGMRQGNDVGTQYRSAIYCADEESLSCARASRDAYQQALSKNGVNAEITTEVELAGPFYFAEDDHQQYLDKHPGGYCGLRGTGVSCPISVEVST